MGFFEDRLKMGQYAEQVLDIHFADKGIQVYPVTEEMERDGIDRIFADKASSVYVEYKADFRAHETGNIFLEHEKNENGHGKPGWARTSRADLLVYYLPPIGQAYIFDMKVVQKNYYTIIANLRKARVLSNPGYTASGYLLPIESALRTAGFMSLIKLDSYTEEELIYKFEYKMLN